MPVIPCLIWTVSASLHPRPVILRACWTSWLGSLTCSRIVLTYTLYPSLGHRNSVSSFFPYPSDSSCTHLGTFPPLPSNLSPSLYPIFFLSHSCRAACLGFIISGLRHCKSLLSIIQGISVRLTSWLCYILLRLSFDG